MRALGRNICIVWLCSAGLIGLAVAQQNDPAPKAEAARKSDAAKAAAAEIDRLEAARLAQAAQREAALNAAKLDAAQKLAAQQKLAAATLEAAKNDALRLANGAQVEKQRKVELAAAAMEVEAILNKVRAAEAAGAKANDPATKDLFAKREAAIAKYRALLAAVPAVPPAPNPVAAPVPAAQPVLNVAVVGDANNAMQREMITRLRPILKVELGLVNRVCHPSEQQRKAIAAAGEECLQSAAQQYAAWQQSGQRGRVVVVNGRATRAMDTPKPRQIIQDGVAKAVKDNLPGDAAALYVAQVKQRSEYRKQLTVENLVSFLDDKLVLSGTQRAAISNALAAAWDENWVSQLQLLTNGSQIFPSIPDQCVVPHLRDSQRSVWQAIPNRNNQVFYDDLQIQSGVAFEDGPEAEVGP